MIDLKIGDAVVKIQGLPFGGLACPACGVPTPPARVKVLYGEGENRRVVAQHWEGWQHIFSPHQLTILDGPAPPALTAREGHLLAALTDMREVIADIVRLADRSRDTLLQLHCHKADAIAGVALSGLPA